MSPEPLPDLPPPPGSAGPSAPKASPGSPASTGGGSGDWLVQAIEGMLVANGWGASPKIAQIKAMLPPGEPHRAFLRGLADQRVLTTEQIAQLDVLVHQQQSLPGFQMLKKVGAGGMGTVYLAIHRASGEQIALKVISARLALDSDFLGRFHRETTALQGLRHPHICNVVESGAEGSTHYLAMEYINGPALAGLLKEYRALPESYVLNIVRQVAEGLSYVWSKAGIVHRDIKPENILVQRSGTGGDLFPLDDVAKLIDFGLVKMANEDEHLTQTGMTIGTPLYMSPEQVRGEKLDCRSDIYGLGATAYHLLTGMPPFRASSPGAIMSAHLTEPVPDPGDLVPGLSASVRRLVQTTMAKVADDRFIDFTALLRAIDQALEEVRERSGAGKMQLLRKPLVVKKTASKRNESAESGENLVPTPMREGTSRRVLRKHIELRQSDSGEIRPGMQPRIVAPSIAGDALSRKTGDTPPPAPVRDAGHESSERRPIDLEPGTDALTRTPSSKERALRQVAANQPVAPPPDLARSAVFDEDPTRTAGAGIVPWIILAAAGAVAVVCAVWQMVGR